MQKIVCLLTFLLLGVYGQLYAQFQPQIVGLDSEYCLTSPPAQITGLPPGGEFSGPGVVANTLFIPAIAGLGAHTITYKITTPFGTAQTTKVVTVIAAPTATIQNLPTSICRTAAPIPLTGSPSGGTFSGNGVEELPGEGYVFNPSSVQPGNYNIIYSGGEDGCNYVTTAQIQVTQGPNVQIQGPATHCVSGAAAQYSSSVAGGTFSGPGITGAGVFTPSVAGVGQHTITYAGTAQGCAYSVTRQVRVNAVPQVIFSGITQDTSVCQNSFPIQISATPAGGIFEGCGVETNGLFDPFFCEGSVNITYSGTSDGCPYSKTLKITILTPIIADFDFPEETCINGEAITLSGTPTGGEFFGNGVSGNQFKPSDAGLGLSEVYYAGTASNGCEYFVGKSIFVSDVPQAKIFGIKADTTVCAFSPAITLTAEPLGGTFSGCGVNANGTFAPTTCLGPVTITYSGSVSGCSFSTTLKVTVIDKYTASFTGLPDAVCTNAAAVTLSGTPGGGAFSGTGVSGSQFNPQTAGAGNFTVTYSGTLAGCAFTTAQPVTVGAIPDVQISGIKPDTTICAFSSPITLTGSPAGGEFSGCGVTTQGVFNPGQCNGAVEIRYSGIKDGCSYERKISVNVVTTFPATLTGLPENMCINQAAVTLSGMPTGGSFSGAGINGNQFNPAQAGEGTHVINYSGNISGCTFSARDTVTVTALPSPKIEGIKADTTVCAFSNAIQLSGQPSGGTWSGCGMQQNGGFLPSNCSGAVTITYSGNVGACAYSTTVSVNVVNQFAAQINNLPETACPGTEAFVITGSPAGGTFAGAGVSNGIFNPALAGVGTHIISYVGNQAGCSFNTTKSITINENPVVNITGIKADTTVCAFSSPIQLGVSPTGGVWSGCGVNASGLFAPTTCEGPITLTYAGSVGNCPYEKTIPLKVLKSYPASIAALPDSVCINSATLTLSADPAGGTFGGPGVSGTNFTPAQAGSGKKIILYNGTFAGCPYQATDSIIVSTIPTVSINGLAQDTMVCALSPAVQLTASPLGGTFSGCGVSANGLFSPAGCPAGATTVTYAGTRGGCAYSKTLNLTLAFEVPANLSSIPSAVCIVSESIQLSASPSGGTFSGPGISGSTFNPQAAGEGTKTINYSGVFAGCPFSGSKEISVNPVPVASISGLVADTTVCAFSNPLQLVGNPSSGTFSGCGVNASGLFAPTTCEGPITITYSGISNGCAYTTNLNLRVRQQFDGSITIPTDSVCINSTAVSLSATPAGGVFGGPGVSGVLFNPATAGVGTHIINYVGNVGNCPYQITRSITVSAVPQVSILGIKQDSTVCAFSPAVQLNGSPSGGTFSGCGVSQSGSFAPSACSPGITVITYSGTKAGCSYSGTLSVVVTQQFSATISGLPTEVCQNSTPVTLSGNPAGGTFSGSGISGNSFNPSSAGLGSKTISYTGSFAGCPYSTNATVLVNALPQPTITGIKADSTVCAFSNPLQLTGSPAGGTFSGCGVNASGVFAPTACEGNIIITYAGTTGGCDYSKTINLNVIQQYPATISNLPDSICFSSNSVTLAASPSGGTFTGAGMSGAVFNPAQAGAGVHIISYNGVSAGCGFGTTARVVVTAVPNPTLSGIPADTTICRTSPPIQVSAQPAGGVFSGCGIGSTGIFTPAGCLGPVTLTYAGNTGGCSYTKSVTFTVVNSITTTFTGLPANTCQSGEAVTLSGSPAGGIFSGPGVNGTQFNPALAGAGTHIISYSGLVGNCGYTTTRIVVVYPNPIYTTSTTAPTCHLCTNGKIEVTVFVGTPPLQYSINGGAFQSSNVFNGLGGGTYAITVRDANGCQASQIATIVPPPPSCDPPTNITVTVVAPGIAQATWDVVLGAFQYLVRYRVSGSPTWTTATTTTANIQLTGLSSQGIYELQVRSVCFNGIDGGYSAPVDFVGIQSTNCNNPTNFQTSNATISSIIAKWTPAQNVGLYHVQYRRADQSNWSLVTAAGSSVIISNLRPNTQYVARIRSVCGNNVGLWSVPITFITASLRDADESISAVAQVPFVTLYPNPARESFTLELFHFNEPAEVVVYSLTGTQIAQYTVGNDTRTVIPVAHWAQGTYLCKITTASGRMFVEKVVITQ